MPRPACTRRKNADEKSAVGAFLSEVFPACGAAPLETHDSTNVNSIIFWSFVDVAVLVRKTNASGIK